MKKILYILFHRSVFVGLSLLAQIATLLVIKAITAKKHAGIFAEMAEADKALYSK